jgi:general L-amino acid transport system permease protein
MWLFVASLLLPLFLNTDPNNLPAILRAYVAITLFSAAYMAENVRGGPAVGAAGQTEAAQALGLSGWQTMRSSSSRRPCARSSPRSSARPSASSRTRRSSSSSASIDFFRVTEIIATQPASLLVTGGVKLELYLFISVVYFFFAYRMSIASRQLERSSASARDEDPARPPSEVRMTTPSAPAPVRADAPVGGERIIEIEGSTSGSASSTSCATSTCRSTRARSSW